MTSAETILINQRLDALHRRDEEARKAISALCGRVTSLEEFSSMHNMAISHCTGGCKAELHKEVPLTGVSK